MEFIGMLFIIGCFIYLSWYAIAALFVGLAVIGLINAVPSEHIPVIKDVGRVLFYVFLAGMFLSIFI